MPEFRCEHCPSVLASKKSLYHHMKRKHEDQCQSSTGGNSYCCSICDHTSASNNDLILHYNDRHDKKLTVLQKEFAAEINFKEWKSQLEKKTNSWFVQHGGKRRTQEYEITYYYCNRSGEYTSKGAGSRSLKSQGSSKMGGKCPAFMTKRMHKSSGRVSMKFCADHVGHESQICHLQLSSEFRNMICCKLASGMEPKQLLDNIRDNIVKTDRDAIVTKKDILNIRKQYHLTPTEKHTEDAQSVAVNEELTTDTVDDLNLQRSKVLKDANVLIDLVKVADQECLGAIWKHLKSAIAVGRDMEPTEELSGARSKSSKKKFKNKKKKISNKKKRFYSTQRQVGRKPKKKSSR